MPRTVRVKAEPVEEPTVWTNEPVPSEGMDLADDESDEVVREIDIYLSPSLASELYLMQFPLQHRRPAPLPDAARIRPRHGMLELDEQIPPNVGHDGAFHLSHRTHTSHTVPVPTHMALGRFDNSGKSSKAVLHLVPLSHVTQMRPGFSHVDETDVQNEMDEAEDDKMERKPLMFQKKESERAAMMRKSSYAHKKASEESEDWQELTVNDRESLAYQDAMKKVPCPSAKNELMESLSADRDTGVSYVRSLNYLPAVSVFIDGTDASAGSSSELSHVCAKLTTLLQRGWPVPYNILRDQFPSVQDNDLISALSSCAVLVRGNFVLQSRLLQLPTEIGRARTFTLYLLQTFGFVQRSRLEHAFQENGSVTSEVILALLEQVAEKTGENGWQLKLSDNSEFCEKFSGQTQLHLQYWERQATRFADVIQLYSEASTSE